MDIFVIFIYLIIRTNFNSLFVLFYSWQLLFFVFVGLLLQTEVLSKPYQSQDLLNRMKRQWFGARENPRQTLDETRPSRGKRQVISLEDLCPRYRSIDTSRDIPSTLPCVERIVYFPAHNLTHYICKKLDFSCIPSIPRIGSPSCVPSGSKVVVIYKGTPNERKVEITTGCACAWNSIINFE